MLQVSAIRANSIIIETNMYTETLETNSYYKTDRPDKQVALTTITQDREIIFAHVKVIGGKRAKFK